MVDENRIEGVVRDIGGKVQDAVGALSGDTATQARGKVNQVAGQAQDTYGKVVDDVREFASDSPLRAMLAALGVGAILGFIIGRR
jgi:uncharacterized protein YjbJ (UPF0337 family)